MAVLQLVNRMSADSLILPGVFIDFYVPNSRGEDLKVFLYLLRMMSKADSDISLASLSDALDTSERDILRSLTYWEKAGLLQLSFNSDHVLEGVAFLDIEPPRAQEKKKEADASSAPSPGPKEPSQKPRPVPRDLTAQETAGLEGDLDFQGFVFMAEQSFGTPLNGEDARRLGYWYINFNRSTDILEALLEYCTAQCRPGRPNTRYFDTVAAGWFSEGISSADQAREYSQSRTSVASGVMKAFGLKSKRDPNPAEQELIRKWSRDYGFSLEMILLACTRTASKTSTDQFAYADKILSAWHTANITTPAQVEAADLQHRKRSAASRRPVEISKSARQFHNFEERDTDYESLILNQLREQQ